MGVLNVPIQINGGTSVPTTSTLNLDRELYVTDEKDLYVNTSSNVGKVNCGISDQTRRISHSNTSIFDFNVLSTTFSLGYLRYNNRVFTASGDVTFSGIGINNLDSLILSTNIYGTRLPSSGTNGQVFFVLQ